MKQHPNSGATIWATLAQKDCTPNTVLNISTFPAGQRVFVIATGETGEPGTALKALSALDVALSADGVPFRAGHVERWFVREMPGHGALIGNKPWDRHPAYAGPMDSFIYVFNPKESDDRAAAEAALPATPTPPEPEPLVVTAPEPEKEPEPEPAPAPVAASKTRTKRLAAPAGTATVTKVTTRSRVTTRKKT